MSTKTYGTTAKGDMHTEDVAASSLECTNTPRTINDSDDLFEQTTEIVEFNFPLPEIQKPPRKPHKQTLPPTYIQKKGAIELYYEHDLNANLSYEQNNKLEELSISDDAADKPLEQSWRSLGFFKYADEVHGDDTGSCLMFLPKVRPIEEPIPMTDVVSDEKFYGHAPVIIYSERIRIPKLQFPLDRLEIIEAETREFMRLYPDYRIRTHLDRSSNTYILEFEYAPNRECGAQRPHDEIIDLAEVISGEKAKIYGDAQPPPDVLDAKHF